MSEGSNDSGVVLSLGLVSRDSEIEIFPLLRFTRKLSKHPNTVLVVINTNIKYPIKTKYYIVNLSARAFQFY